MFLNKTKFIITKGFFFFFLLLPWRNKLFLHWTCCLLTPSLLLCLPCLQPRSLCILSALLNLTDFHLWSSKPRRGSNTIGFLWEGQSEASGFPPGCSLLHSFCSFHKLPAFVLPDLYIFWKVIDVKTSSHTKSNFFWLKKVCDAKGKKKPLLGFHKH